MSLGLSEYERLSFFLHAVEFGDHVLFCKFVPIFACANHTCRSPIPIEHRYLPIETDVMPVQLKEVSDTELLRLALKQSKSKRGGLRQKSVWMALPIRLKS